MCWSSFPFGSVHDWGFQEKAGIIFIFDKDMWFVYINFLELLLINQQKDMEFKLSSKKCIDSICKCAAFMACSFFY